MNILWKTKKFLMLFSFSQKICFWVCTSFSKNNKSFQERPWRSSKKTMSIQLPKGLQELLSIWKKKRLKKIEKKTSQNWASKLCNFYHWIIKSKRWQNKKKNLFSKDLSGLGWSFDYNQRRNLTRKQPMCLHYCSFLGLFQPTTRYLL